MKTSKLLGEDVLIDKAVNVLVQELGPIEASRFLSIKSSKRMESVKRHRQWQSKLDRKSFLDEVLGE